MTISRTTPSQQTGPKLIELCQGAPLRLVLMMTHYRRPADFTDTRLEEAKIILQRWMFACEPCPEPHFCPTEILECYCDDMNTAKAIAVMHRYRKEGKGKELFKAMKFLGFFGDPSSVHEVKTLPEQYENGFGETSVNKLEI